jgi:hypothetical protein
MVITLSLLALAAWSAWAGSIDPTADLTQFSAHTPAVADQVNGNFTVVADEVTNNAADIATKQNRVTGTCPEGESIRKINANGSVTCEPDDTGGDLAGIDFKSYRTAGGFDVTRTTQTVTSVAVTAPTDGWVLASASGNTYIDHNKGATGSLLKYILTTSGSYSIPDIIVGSLPESLRFFSVPSAAHPGMYTGTLATHRVFEVQGDTTKTIYLRARAGLPGSASDVSIVSVSIQAIFVPNRY